MRILILLALLFAPLAQFARAYTPAELKAVEAKVKSLVTRNLPAVISLMGDSKPVAGSGVIVSEDGLILTAAHVIEGSKTMSVLFPDGTRKKCEILGANFSADIAMARIVEKGKYPFVEIGDSDKMEATTMVVAMGHPGGYDSRRTPPVRIGRITVKNAAGFLITDCTLIGGDSGGPLFDLEGRVVGIHSSISISVSVNRCAHVSSAKRDWDRLLAGEQWGKLGGALAELFGGGDGDGDDDRPALGLVPGETKDGGVSVTLVHPRSPADAAGIKPGDIVITFDGKPIADGEKFSAAVSARKPGDKVEIKFRRDGEEKSATATLMSHGGLRNRMGLDKPQRRKK